MDLHETDTKRRKFLTVVTSGMGGLGLAAVSVPFLKSLLPSEAAKTAGAPVRADIGDVAPGELLTVAWRGKPVWILHRTEPMLDRLRQHDDLLLDPQSTASSQQPDYARNATRSIKPQYLVAVGICTHLGCVPQYRPDVAPADIGREWPGGFFCPCHKSKFDLAGRVFKRVPAPLNLVIPPHRYLSDTQVLIGEDSKPA